MSDHGVTFAEEVDTIANRDEVVEVGLDPSIVIPILTLILPKLFACLNDNDDVMESQVQRRVQVLYAKDPERLLKRTRVAVEREHKRNERKKPKRDRVELTRAQSEALAQAIIFQTLDTDVETVTSACMACSTVAAMEG